MGSRLGRQSEILTSVCNVHHVYISGANQRDMDISVVHLLCPRPRWMAVSHMDDSDPYVPIPEEQHQLGWIPHVDVFKKM